MWVSVTLNSQQSVWDSVVPKDLTYTCLAQCCVVCWAPASCNSWYTTHTCRSKVRCMHMVWWRQRHKVLNYSCPHPLTPHPSPLTPHPSPLTPHPSPLTPHPSPLTPHPSPLTILLPYNPLSDYLIKCSRIRFPEDDQSILIETLIKTIYYSKENFYMVSP